MLRRLNAPPNATERHRIEDIAARARLLIALAALVAIYLDPTQPSRYEVFAHTLLFLYVVHSVVVAALIHAREELPHYFAHVVHGTDVGFAVLITLLTEGPSSPFFVFFFFVLMTAAFRWGFLETVATGVVCTFMLVAEMLLLGYGARQWGWVNTVAPLNVAIVRATYLLLVSILLGYLAENEKEQRAETATIGRIIAHARPEQGLRGSLQTVFGELLSIFDAQRVVTLINEGDTGRVFVWLARKDAEGETELLISEIEPRGRANYLVRTPAHSLSAEWEGGQWNLLGLDSDGRRIRDLPPIPEDLPASLGEAHSLISVAFVLGQEWAGRLMLLDVGVSYDRQAELRFVQRLARQVGPAVYSVYLLRKLRRRAGAIERARVARELHDGAIQSLISLEMQINVLRRRATDGCSPLQPDLERIENQLHKEVLNLRELMYQMKPVEVGPHQLLDFLAEAVDRFRRDTGIHATFVTEMEEANLPSRVARELLRIAQEALVNVRKHSGASNVVVRFAMQEGRWKLIIDDDGRGFKFAGRLTQDEMDAARNGPTIIKERVRSISGQLTIESTPGRGARLEISVPRKTQAAHG